MSAPNREVAGFRHVIGSSELGSCLKAQAACLMGYTPLPVPDKMADAYQRGYDHEDACLSAMTEQGWLVHSEQAEYVIDCGNGIGVVVHPDAQGSQPFVLPGAERVIEVKSPNAWTETEKAFRTGDFSSPYMHRIAWQVSCQMNATGLEALVCCLEDGTVKTFGIEVPPFDLAQIEQRVGEIIGFVEGGLPGSCSQNDWPCPVAYLHETEDVEEDPELDALVWAYETYAEGERIDAAAKKRAAEKIREHLAGKDRTTLASKVTFYEQKASVKYDMDRIAADFDIHLADYATTGKPSQRMKITKRGSDEPQEASGD